MKRKGIDFMRTVNNFNELQELVMNAEATIPVNFQVKGYEDLIVLYGTTVFISDGICACMSECFMNKKQVFNYLYGLYKYDL